MMKHKTRVEQALIMHVQDDSTRIVTEIAKAAAKEGNPIEWYLITAFHAGYAQGRHDMRKELKEVK